MPTAHLPSVRLYYELSGPIDGDPLVLIHGLGAQMIAWYPGLIALLEAEGFRVLRFDNRDVGLSQKFETPAGGGSPYDIHAMANDVVELLDHVGFSGAHIAGQSMGGMIAQQVAIDHPEYVHSLVSIYSSPAPGFMVDDPEVQAVRSETPEREREGAIAQYVRRERMSGYDGFDEEWMHNFAAQVVDRDWDPAGADRQEAAVLHSPDRRPALANVMVPAAVIHGRDDRLIGFDGGVATAVALPNAELHIFTDMGHQLPPRYWPDFVRIFCRVRDRVRRARYALHH